MTFSTLTCSGDVLLTAEGAPTCSGAWMLVQVPEPFDVTTLDASALAQSFATGFIVCAVPICIGLGAKALLNAIRGT